MRTVTAWTLAALPCAMLYYAILCCAVLCYPMLCYPVLRCTVLYCAERDIGTSLLSSKGVQCSTVQYSTVTRSPDGVETIDACWRVVTRLCSLEPSSTESSSCSLLEAACGDSFVLYLLSPSYLHSSLLLLSSLYSSNSLSPSPSGGVVPPRLHIQEGEVVDIRTQLQQVRHNIAHTIV